VSWEWFRGEFETWDEAARLSGSYAAEAILERVVAASRDVRDGRAAYERDGCAFSVARPNAPLLTALARAASGSGGGLRVLDFGGALGSLYWQHRASLEALHCVAWRVVEQEHYVVAGRHEFEDDVLSFWPDIAGASRGKDLDIAVLSSVLQYLPAPYTTLEELVGLAPHWMFFDRLALVVGGRDRLTIEHVPAELGGGSYPVWFLSEARFLDALSGRYRLVDRFLTRLEGETPECWEVFGTNVPNQGFLFRLGE
jgi:putative methyltransferase (TIGR04325 family)